MKMLAIPAAALVLFAIAATPASADAKRGDWTKCGDQNPAPLGAPYTNLKADNVSCKGAHRVATKFTKKPFTEGYKGWACDSKQAGFEELKVKCWRDNRGGQYLKFFWGA